jgi:mannose-6-phosphate isomerase-like protein (cupin superfamily)
MIRKKSEIVADVRHDFRGGVGEVAIHPFMNEEEAIGAGRLFARLIIEKPGDSIGQHVHQGELEVYHILQGKALVNDNGREVVLEPGDTHICVDGDFHSVENVGEDTLEFIAIILHTKQKEV